MTGESEPPRTGPRIRHVCTTWAIAMLISMGCLSSIGCSRSDDNALCTDSSLCMPVNDANRADTQTTDVDSQRSTPPVEITPYNPSTYQTYNTHPEPPTILRDVALIDDNAEFTQPFVPGHRTTMDGRVALRVQGGPPGGEMLRTMLSFSLFVPERLNAPIMTGPPGAEILADVEPYNVVFPPALDPNVSILGHHAICDPTQAFAAPGERTNPYACGPDNRNDCYAFTIISSTSDGSTGAQLWGVPATIEVQHPKTAQAQIIHAELGAPVAGVLLPYMNEWTEPSVSRDGRLLTGRFGRSPREWIHPQSGEEFTRFYDLGYSVLPDDADPCDVTGWVHFHPTSHAPYDPDMIGTYGLAAYPFRDSEGNLIPDGEDVGGTYPWVDREGNNVFMTGVQGRVHEQSKALYPRRCVVEGCETHDETFDWNRGFLVAGSWTHGRFVHLDGLINNQDWAVGVAPEAHYLVDLYQTGDGAPVPVRFGAGRFIDALRGIGPYPKGYTHNANIMDSLQNLFNYRLAALPITPRDVVWVMSTGVATDEIAFDDYLDPNALIVSNMQASVTQHYDEALEMLTSQPIHHNGQVRVNEAFGIPLPDANILQADEAAAIHLQNGATSLRWNVPAYGLVEAGKARVEPVALGGFRGRGFWLDGTTNITYAIPEQPRDVHETDWYVGIYLDPRAASDEMRALLSLPDGSALHIDGHARIQYVMDGTPIHQVDLPALTGSGWLHLGLRILDGGREIILLHNGFSYDRFRSDQPILQPVAGALRLGAQNDTNTGFRGWIDDFVVLAHDVDPEVACNHAFGTLMRLDPDSPLNSAAMHYQDWAHASITTASGGTDADRYICHVDYSRDFATHAQNRPEGLDSVRQAIHFPEGPVRYGAPRPDSSDNAFCLTCHHQDGRTGLGLNALEYRADIPAEHDPRRQPNQPPRRVFGNIPEGFIPAGAGPGSPITPEVAPDDGFLIDAWLLPHAE